jgi:hypothetical protein
MKHSFRVVVVAPPAEESDIGKPMYGDWIDE